MELGVSIYYLQKALKYYERDLEKTTLKAKKNPQKVNSYRVLSFFSTRNPKFCFARVSV